MTDADMAYGRARDRLCIAENAYAAAETELIAARRAVEYARVVTEYSKAIAKLNDSSLGKEK